MWYRLRRKSEIMNPKCPNVRVVTRLIGAVLILAILSQCTPSSHCKKLTAYFKKVDTSKPFWVEGKHCVYLRKDTTMEKNAGIVRLYVFDRTTGDRITQGSVSFDDSMNFSLKDGFLEATLPEGTYNMNVYTHTPHLPFGIKYVHVGRNRIVGINCFIGNSL